MRTVLYLLKVFGAMNGGVLATPLTLTLRLFCQS